MHGPMTVSAGATAPQDFSVQPSVSVHGAISQRQQAIPRYPETPALESDDSALWPAPSEESTTPAVPDSELPGYFSFFPRLISLALRLLALFKVCVGPG